nr:hypothetical protein [uncultured Duganella sp.]
MLAQASFQDAEIMPRFNRKYSVFGNEILRAIKLAGVNTRIMRYSGRHAMNRKLNISPLTEEPPYISNDRPAILGRREMGDVRLPPDFDLTYHKKILASGQVKPATQEDFAREIARLKQKIKDER